MDEFLREINTGIFRQWIMNQSREGFIVKQTSDPDIISINTPSSYTEISFNAMEIIEFVVKNKNNQRVEFYIHFQMNTLSHAVGLYVEMLECISSIVETNVIKILLCCSGGLTTGLFADDLNRGAELLGLDYTFSAVPYTKLYEVGMNYDIILLAPQISFEHVKVIQALKDPLVIKIPPKVFAKYKVNELLELINKKLITFKNKKENITYDNSQEIPSTNEQILCINIKRVQAPRININYTLFQYGKVVTENEIIKTSISEKDIYDIVEVMFAKYPKIKLVGISMLGIVNDYGVYLPNHPLDDFDFMTPLREKYDATFILENDVNCAALGYYYTQNKYSSISMVTKTRQEKPGGVGSVIDGKLIRGKNNLAGEVQFLPIDIATYTNDFSGYVEQLAHSILGVIALLSPEAIVVYAPVVSETEDIIYYINQKLPRRFIPEIILVNDLKEYAALGLLQLCIDASTTE